MRIAAIEHQVTDVAAAAEFYNLVLQLPVALDGCLATVTIGSSTLQLTSGPTTRAVHHLAFDIPAECFDQGKEWLSARVPLLRASDGSQEFNGPPKWDSRSLYFSGPDRTILELIARRRLHHTRVSGEFSGSHLVNISEVGVAVDDVALAARQLGCQFDLSSYGPTFEDFDPIGDESGLIILVAAGRAWAPDSQQHSGQLALTVHLSAEHEPPRSMPLSNTCTVTNRWS